MHMRIPNLVFSLVLTSDTIENDPTLSYEHSLILAFKSNRLQGPIYISNMLKVRSSHYNFRNSGQNCATDIK